MKRRHFRERESNLQWLACGLVIGSPPLREKVEPGWFTGAASDLVQAVTSEDVEATLAVMRHVHGVTLQEGERVQDAVVRCVQRDAENRSLGRTDPLAMWAKRMCELSEERRAEQR